MGIVLKSLLLRNVASYGTRNNMVRFEDFGYPIYVSGPNGAGKTTFFVDGVSFALFGSAYGVTRGAGKLFVPAGKRSGGEVVLELGVDYRRTIIRRWYDGRAWRVEIRREVDGKLRLVTNSSVEAAKYIRNLLGLDYEGFINSVVVRQGDVYSFLDAKPSERRELILKLLNINFQPVRDRLKEISYRKSSELRGIEGEMQVIETQLRYKDFEEIENERKELEKEISTRRKSLDRIEKKITSLDEEIKTVSGELGAYKERFRRLEKLSKETNSLFKRINMPSLKLDIVFVKELNSFLDSYMKLSDRINEIEADIKELKEIEKLFSELDSLTGEIDKRRERKEEIIREASDNLGIEPSREALEKLSSEIGGLRNKTSDTQEKLGILRDTQISICPLCGQEISDEHRYELITRLAKELSESRKQLEELSKNKKLLEKFVKDIEKLEGEIGRLEGRIQQIRKRLEGISYTEAKEKLRKYSQEWSDLRDESEKLASELGSKGISRDELDRLIGRKSLLKELEVKLDLLSQVEKELAGIEYDGLKNRLETLEKDRNELREEAKKLRELIGKLERERDELDKQKEYLKRYNELREEAERLEKVVRIYKLLDEYVFKESRFPRFLMKAIVEDILEDGVNNILRTIFPNAHVKLRVEAEARGIDLIVYINNVRRDVSTLSGGEKTLIGFAIRLAIGSLISGLKGGESIDFLIIDEGFGALDTVNRDLVANAIGNLVDSRLYKQVIVISHEADLMNHPVFKAYIYISKENGVSNIKIS